GAYQVESNGKKITFLDTPGHEAFTSMRARGAQVTDISILVVAADDGVMPQTIEAINHSKAAGVSIIVAINKIDKPAANPDKVKQELTEHGLIAEEWGGETIMVPVSAKTGEGLKNLMDMILLVAEVGELKANSKRAARGTVVEAELDKGRGPVATLLIQKGTLRVGDNILAGTVFGKVRAMFDDKNRKVKSAGPSMPVVILGFSEVPPPGEIFMVVKDERDARYVANMQQNKKKEEANNKFTRVSLDDLFKQISEGEVKELNIIIKADVQGSVEAVRQSFDKLSTDEVKVNIIHAGVGAIKESDIMLATASNAIIIGFNVRPDAQTRKAAEIAGVDVRLYRVIYDAIEDIKKAMAGLLDPDFKEVVQGHAEVRQIIKVPKIGLIAGSYVIDGKITRQSEVRIVRDGIVVFEGKILSLRRFKDDAKEVLSGFECGIGIEDFNDIKEGDVLEAFIMEETKREL
ncbi:MAG: translation initiation factor IF-2, partial [Clostridia bacterium]|nr:translation initiation factor IF-2 [Clostridia bacterium]